MCCLPSELYFKHPPPLYYSQSEYCYENNFLPSCPVLPQNPHDPEYLSNPPHLVLVLVGAPAAAPHARGGQQAQDQRGEVGEDAQQVDDVHTALDEPGHHG